MNSKNQPKKSQKRNKRNFFTISLFAALLFVIFSIFMTTNLVNLSYIPQKTLSEFQNDIIEAVNAGPGAFPKFKEINYEINTGLFIVERLFLVNDRVTSEHYSVLGGTLLLQSALQQKIPGQENLTYFQAIFLPNAQALVENFKYGFKISPKGWGESIRDFLPSTISITISLLFLWLLYRTFNRGATANFFSPTGRTPFQKVKSNIKFSDVAGNTEVKEEVKELIDYLKNPKRYASAGARIPKGILLGGPPGTGKTLVAKAVAGEANVPFYFMSASGFVEMIVGVGARRVRELFRVARSDSPSIIFIDELDAVGRSRHDVSFGGGDSEREQTLNQLLVEMDGMIENSGVLIIGATNRHDVLDSALLRPGRFDRLIRISLPDVKERQAILELHAKGKRFDDSVSFARIARRTPGFSGAQLENVINEASLLSVRENVKKIRLEHVDEAIDRVLSGPARKSRTISELENIRVAYHEAGHAVVALKTPFSNKIQKITIIPRGDAGGYNVLVPEEERFFPSRREMFATVIALMGGRASEEIIYGKENVTMGCANDFEQATSMVRRMITKFGMSDTIGPVSLQEDRMGAFKSSHFSQKTAEEVDKEIKKLLEEALDKARQVIKQNMELLELIKDTLIEKETILAEEIEELAQTLKPLASRPPKEADASEDIDSLLDEVSKE